MHITLQKRDKGQTWASPILGQGQLDPYSADVEQKRLMLQRFQEEVSHKIWLFDDEIFWVSYLVPFPVDFHLAHNSLLSVFLLI